jgi:hypothetical protein
MTTYSQLEISRWAYDGDNEIQFVLAEDVQKLKQHNEEMQEALKETTDTLQTMYKNLEGIGASKGTSTMRKIYMTIWNAKSILAKEEEV